MYFLESSALIKLFVDEAGSSAMIRLVESLDDREKCVAGIAFLEVRSAIRRKQREAQLLESHAKMALETAQAEARRLIEYPISAPILSRAGSALDRFALRAMDAIHLGTAMQVEEELTSGERLIFVCSDQRLLDSAKALAMETLDPTADGNTTG